MPVSRAEWIFRRARLSRRLLRAQGNRRVLGGKLY
jgi:hypothetical protein